MPSPAPYRKPLAIFAAALLFAGCGDDETTGPEFGDLEFAPASPVVIGAAREVDVELFNMSNGALGPLVIGPGGTPLSVPREFTCPGVQIQIAPNQIPSLAAGGSVEVNVAFSFVDLTEEQCPLATYEVDVNAATGTQVLGSSQIRVDHLELE
jgi:hypothetical protein